MPELSVVIPLYKATAFLPQLVEALGAQTLDPTSFEVVLVDDASPDDTAELAEQLIASSPLKNMRLERRSENGGVSAARNTGWQAAQSDLILFVDQDCLPDPQLLAAHLAEQSKYRGQAVAVCGRIVWAERYRQDAIAEHYKAVYFPDWKNYQGEGDFWFFVTSNASVSKAALGKAGGFDAYFRHNYDDVMCGYRLRHQAGCRFVLCGEAVVTHDRPLPLDEVIRRNEIIGRETVRVLKHYPSVLGQSWLPDPLKVLDGWYWLLSLDYVLPSSLDQPASTRLSAELVQRMTAYWQSHSRWPDLPQTEPLQTVYRRKQILRQLQSEVAAAETDYRQLQAGYVGLAASKVRPSSFAVMRQVPKLAQAIGRITIVQTRRWPLTRFRLERARPASFESELQAYAKYLSDISLEADKINSSNPSELCNLLMQYPMAIGMQNGLHELFGIRSYELIRHPQFAAAYESWQDQLRRQLAPDLDAFKPHYQELAAYYRKVETAQQRLKILTNFKLAASNVHGSKSL